MVRRQILRQWFLLWALLLTTGTLAQAVEPGVTILNENVSWCTIFHALRLQVTPECHGHLTKTIVLNEPSSPAPANRACAFTTTRIQLCFDSATLAPESHPLLDTLAGVLKDARMADQVVRIEVLGKLAKVPYWQCLQIDHSNPEVQANQVITIPATASFALVLDTPNTMEEILCMATREDLEARMPPHLRPDLAALPVAQLEEIRTVFRQLAPDSLAEAQLQVQVSAPTGSQGRL